jgi:hypothetical protein
MSMFASTGVMGLTAATVTNQACGRCVVRVTGTASQINIDTMRSFMETLMAHLLLTCEFWAERLGVQRSSRHRQINPRVTGSGHM